MNVFSFVVTFGNIVFTPTNPSTPDMVTGTSSLAHDPFANRWAWTLSATNDTLLPHLQIFTCKLPKDLWPIQNPLDPYSRLPLEANLIVSVNGLQTLRNLRIAPNQYVSSGAIPASIFGTFFLDLDMDINRHTDVRSNFRAEVYTVPDYFAMRIDPIYRFPGPIGPLLSEVNGRPTMIVSAYAVRDLLSSTSTDGINDVGVRKRQLNNATAFAGQHLGCNASELNGWTASNLINVLDGPPYDQPWSISPAEVDAIARSNGITHRACHTVTPFDLGHSDITKLYQGPIDPVSGYQRLRFAGLIHLKFFHNMLASDFWKKQFSLTLDVQLGAPHDRSSQGLKNLVLFGLMDEPAFPDSGVIDLLTLENADRDLDADGFFSALQTFTGVRYDLSEINRFTVAIRTDFVNYLKGVNPSGAFWGATRIDDVEPYYAGNGVPRSSITARRRLLHTYEFLRDQLAQGLLFIAQTCSDELVNRAGTDRATLGNFSVFFNSNSYRGQFLKRGTNSRFHFSMKPDYFLIARYAQRLPKKYSQVTWNNNVGAGSGTNLHQNVGHADMMRSAAMLSRKSDVWRLDNLGENIVGPGEPNEFGLYVAAKESTRRHVDEALYQIMPYVGRGAKFVEGFNTSPGDERDDWGQFRSVTLGFSKCSALIKNAGQALWLGRPQRSPIAVLTTRCSEHWDNKDIIYTYAWERTELATACAHAGYALDFIDEKDIIDGQIDKRGYSVLYLTDPNIQEATVDPIIRWVKKGGRLAVMPGAAVHNEYDEPLDQAQLTSRIDQLLGVHRRTLCIDPSTSNTDDRNLFFNFSEKTSSIQDLENSRLQIDLKNFGLISPDTFSPVWIEFADATNRPKWTFSFNESDPDVASLANWVDSANPAIPIGKSALTVRKANLGLAYCYGFYAATHYTSSTYEHPEFTSGARLGWQKSLRDFALAPLRGVNGLIPTNYAQAVVLPVKARFTSPGARSGDHAIDVSPLWSQSGKRVAITLTNWERDPLEDPGPGKEVEISVLFENAVKIVSAACASGQLLNGVVTNSKTVVLRFRLDTVDIISLTVVRKPIRIWVPNNRPKNPQKNGPISDGPILAILADKSGATVDLLRSQKQRPSRVRPNAQLRAAIKRHMDF
jgi:hypothetical protein